MRKLIPSEMSNGEWQALADDAASVARQTDFQPYDGDVSEWIEKVLFIKSLIDIPIFAVQTRNGKAVSIAGDEDCDRTSVEILYLGLGNEPTSIRPGIWWEWIDQLHAIATAEKERREKCAADLLAEKLAALNEVSFIDRGSDNA